MRIIQTIASVDPVYGGPSVSVPALCAALAGRGQKVELHTVEPGHPPSASSSYLARQYPQDAKATPLLRSLRLSSGLKDALQAAAAEAEADLIHTHGVWLAPNLYPAAVARRAGKPLMLSPRGMLSPGALRFSAGRKALFWRLGQGGAVRAADCLHATSDQEYDDLRAMTLKAPVAVIPNGVDLPADRDGVPPARTVLYLGRIHPKKGLDRLVRAWARIEPHRSNWDLRIVGIDELGHAAELRTLAAELKLARISVEGPVYGEAKADLYRAAGLFVLPTLSENFAMTVAEALAHGLPAISTRGAPWRGLDEEGCGWWIDHGADAMADALMTATALDLKELEAMGARGRAWMARAFSWDSVAERMIEAYAWLARGAKRPDCVRLD